MKKIIFIISLLISAYAGANDSKWIVVTDDVLMLNDFTQEGNRYTKEIYAAEGWVYYKSLNQYRNFRLACSTKGYYHDSLDGKIINVLDSIPPNHALFKIKKLVCL